MSTSTAPVKNTQSALRRFTLMLSGEDSLEDQSIGDRPSKGLPHERYLLGKLVPSAPALLLGQSNQTVDPNLVIACLQPVHLHAGRDHLILMGQNQLDLTIEESSKLLKVASPLLEEDFQGPVLFHNQYFWFIPAGPFSSLTSYSIDQALGRNIDWWMPHHVQDESVARHWRKLQNEIQMLWHIDPVNEEREQHGLPSMNSLWISGIGKLSDIDAPQTLRQADRIYGQHPLLIGLARYLNLPINETIHNNPLSGTFAWPEAPESIWPLLKDALSNKQLDELLIIDFPNGKTRERKITAKDLHRKSWVFWKKAEPLSWKDILQS
jgi:hypothetical protein